MPDREPFVQPFISTFWQDSMGEKVQSGLGAPVEAKERYMILDALRGFALLGVCLANYQEFS